MNAEELLQALLSAPPNSALWDEARRRAPELLESLDRQDVLLPDEVGGEAVARLSRMLHDVAPVTAASGPGAEEAAAVGRAFRERLLDRVPHFLTNFLTGTWFAALPKVGDAVRHRMLVSPGVQAALPEAADLVRHGITPLTIYDATEAPARLREGLVRHQRYAGAGIINLNLRQGLADVEPPQPVRIVRRPASQPTEPIPAITVSMLLRETMALADCTPEMAHALLSWLLHVSRYKPLVFRDFEARWAGSELSLRPSSEVVNLAERWGTCSEFALASVASGTTIAVDEKVGKVVPAGSATAHRGE